MTDQNQVMRLFERANPVPDPAALPPAPPPSNIRYHRTDRTATVTLIDTPPDLQPPNTPRRMWPTLTAIAAVVIVVVAGLALVTRGGADREEPADQPKITTPVEPDPATVGAAFVSAIDNHDHDTALRLLADDATVQMLGSTDATEFGLLLDFLAAIDARYDLAGCDYAEPAVTCRALFTNAWFEPLDVPATTATFFIRVDDGQVTAFRHAEEVPDQVWSTWSKFVRSGGEGDWGAMAKSHPDGAAIIGPVLTEESIELHRQYTAKFVEAYRDS